MNRITNTQRKVLEILHERKKPVYGLLFSSIIFSDETVKKWSHQRRHKSIIDTMTFSYLGKMAKKGLISSDFKGNYYITSEGSKFI